MNTKHMTDEELDEFIEELENDNYQWWLEPTKNPPSWTKWAIPKPKIKTYDGGRNGYTYNDDWNC